MKIVAVLLLAIALTGCATKANVHKVAGVAPPKPAHDRDVCLMRGALPSNIDAEFQGRGVSNSYWYGGYEGPKKVLADKARASGVDVISEMRYRQVIGFFALVRPRVQGTAYSLKDPAAFNCLELGGEVYSPYGPRRATYIPEPIPAPEKVSPSGYDQCMERVLRISDPVLRVKAMSTCDDVENVKAYALPSYTAPQNSVQPSYSAGGPVYVRGYYRKNGTYVRPHTRRSRR